MAVYFFVFSDKFYLKRHILNAHLNQKFACQTCGKQYSSDRPCGNCDLSKCPVCSKGYASLYLTRHLRDIHRVRVGNRKYSCLSCEEDFPNQVTWFEHLSSNAHKTNDSKLNVYCCICNKEYRRRRDLSQHFSDAHLMKVRAGNFHCIPCNQSLPDISTAKEHMVKETHSSNVEKAKPKCNECGKSFSCAKTLRIHMKIHVKSISPLAKGYVAKPKSTNKAETKVKCYKNTKSKRK